MTKIKPCPFCGKDIKVTHIHLLGVYDAFKVKCECGIETIPANNRCQALRYWREKKVYCTNYATFGKILKLYNELRE